MYDTGDGMRRLVTAAAWLMLMLLPLGAAGQGRPSSVHVAIGLGNGQSAGLEVNGQVITGIRDISGPRRGSGGQVYQFARPRTDESSREGFGSWITRSGFGRVGSATSRKNASIIVYDYAGTPIRRYTLVNAWPADVEIGALKAGATDVATETLTIAFEHIEPR